MRSKIEEVTAGKSGKIYTGLLDSISYTTPHKFVGEVYGLYLQRHPDNPNVNGRIFEYLICETLAQRGILPFYYQGRFERVPNADFDIVLYNKTHPIVLTMKVSLRERYKQADLEGWALRQVYRNAESYLITLSKKEAPGIVQKIKAGDIAGLNKCVLANKAEFSSLIGELSKRQFSYAKPVMPINGKPFPVPST